MIRVEEYDKADRSPFSIRVFSKSTTDAFDHMGVLKYNNLVFFAYEPHHQHNLRKLYEDVYATGSLNTLFSDFLLKIIDGIDNTLDIINSEKNHKSLKELPIEIAMIRKDWIYCQNGFGIGKGGFFSKYYAITSAGTSYQFIEPIIFFNMERTLFKLLKPLFDDQRVIVIVEAYMKLFQHLQYNALVDPSILSGTH
jgi:hypothetical protein